jgi:hypothetical protein
MLELSANVIEVINIVGVLVIVVALWGIAYFLTRIFTHYYIRKHLGDMPSREEIAELYRANNDIIEYRKHSPTVTRNDAE